MSFQPPKKKAAKSFAVPKRSVDSSGDGHQIVGKEPPLVKKKENVTGTSKPGFSKPLNTVPPAREKTTKKEKKVKEILTEEVGSEQTVYEKKKVKKRKAKSENDENTEPAKPKRKKPKKKSTENKEKKPEGESKRGEKVKKVKDGVKKSKDGEKRCGDEGKEAEGINEHKHELEGEQNEMEDHFEALLNDIEDMQVEVDENDEKPDENGVVLDIDMEALPDDIRLEVLKQTNEITTAVAWRSGQGQGDETLLKSEKRKDSSGKIKKKKKKRLKSEARDTEPCGTATGDENVDVFSPLESQEKTQDEIYEEKTEKKVRKKRKNKKPKKVAEETEIIEEDVSGLMESDSAEDGDGVKSLSPLERLEAEIMKAELEEEGTWVQCDNRWCRKWRLLGDVSDPAGLPNKWTCDMNTDEDFNSCDIPEQTWDKENEENFVYAEFTEGSIVWAKMDGYPWWPAMIQNDPDLRTFYESEDNNPMMPLYYHVVFLDKKQSRAWVRKSCIKAFNCNQEEEVVAFPYMAKGQSYKKQRDFALQQAVIAAGMTIEEKLVKFGFKQKKYSKTSQRYHDLQMSMSDDDDFDVPKPKERGSRKKRKVDGENLDDVKPVSKQGKSDVKKKVKKDQSRGRTDKDGKKMKKKKTRNDVEKHLKVLPENPKVDFKFRSNSQKSRSGSQNCSSQKNDRVNCIDNENDGGVLDIGDADVVFDDDDVDDGAEADSESDADVDLDTVVVSANDNEIGCGRVVLKEEKVGGELTKKGNMVEKTQEFDMEELGATGDAKVGDTGDKEEKRLKRTKKKEMTKSEAEGKDGKKKKFAKPKKKETSECVLDCEKKMVKAKKKVKSEDGEKKEVKPKKKKVTVEGAESEKKLKKRVKKKINEEGVGKYTGVATDQGKGEEEPKKKVKKQKISDEDKDTIEDVDKAGEKKAKKMKKKKSSDEAKDTGDDVIKTDGEKKPKKKVKKMKKIENGDETICADTVPKGHDENVTDKTQEDKDARAETVEKVEGCDKDAKDETETDDTPDENPVETADGIETSKDKDVEMCCDGDDKSRTEDLRDLENEGVTSNVDSKDLENVDEVPKVDTKDPEAKESSPVGEKAKKKKTVMDRENVEKKKKKMIKSVNTEDKKKKVVGAGGEAKEKKTKKKRIKSESEGEEKQKRKKVKGKVEAVKTKVSVDTEELTRIVGEEQSVTESVGGAEDNAREKKDSVADSPDSKSGKKVQDSDRCSPSVKSKLKADKTPIRSISHGSMTVKKVPSSPPANAAASLKVEKKVAGPMDRFLVKPTSKFVAPVSGKVAPKTGFVAPVVSKSITNAKTDTTQTAVKTKADTPKKVSKLSLKKQKNDKANSQKERSQNHEVKTVAEVHEVFDKDCLQELDLLEASRASSQCSVPADPRPESPVMEFEDLEMDVEKPDSQVLQISTQCDSPQFDLTDNPNSQAMDVGPASPAMSVDGDGSQEMDLYVESQPKYIEESSSSLQVVNES